MSLELELPLIVVPGLVLFYLLFYIFADLPYKRKKEQEAVMKASTVSSEGVWPPAPTTYAGPQETQPWAWCMQCHRASTMDAVSDNGGRCGYEDCSAPLSEMVAWCDLAAQIDTLPEQPQTGTVYANLVRVKEPATEAGAATAL